MQASNPSTFHELKGFFEEPRSLIEERMEISKPEKCNGIMVLAAAFNSLKGDKKRNLINSERQHSFLLCALGATQELFLFLPYF